MIWWILAILGVILAVWLGPRLILRFYIWKTARELLREDRVSQDPNPEYRIADPKEFMWADHAKYDQMQRELEMLNYRKLADSENVTETNQTPYLRRFSRIMLSQCGTICAIGTQVKFVPEFAPRKLRNIAVEDKFVRGFRTEFDDGTFLETHAATARHLDSLEVPGIHTEIVPANCDVTNMESRHRRMMAVFEERGVNAIILVDLESALASSARMAQLSEDSEIVHRATLAGLAADPDAKDLLREYQRQYENSRRRSS